MDYLKKVDQITHILYEHNRDEVIHQIKSAKVMGGTGGEILSLICSLVKTHEIQSPDLFDAIKYPAYELFNYAKTIELNPSANFDLLSYLN